MSNKMTIVDFDLEGLELKGVQRFDYDKRLEIPLYAGNIYMSGLQIGTFEQRAMGDLNVYLDRKPTSAEKVRTLSELSYRVGGSSDVSEGLNEIIAIMAAAKFTEQSVKKPFQATGKSKVAVVYNHFTNEDGIIVNAYNLTLQGRLTPDILIDKVIPQLQKKMNVIEGEFTFTYPTTVLRVTNMSKPITILKTVKITVH